MSLLNCAKKGEKEFSKSREANESQQKRIFLRIFESSTRLETFLEFLKT